MLTQAESPKRRTLPRSPNWRDLVACVIIVAVATLVMLPAFVRGFPNGDDADLHYRWATQFFDALREGVIYPRWLGEANNGEGSPVMLYYPPLLVYVVAGLKLVVGETLKALTWACWLGLAVSGLTMYAFSRSILNRWIAVFVAAFYILAPYHVFDLYQRSALAEFWAFAWLPIIPDAIHRLSAGRSWASACYLAVGYGLLLLTHVPTSFAVALIAPLYVLILTRDRRALSRIAVGFVLGFGIGSVFLVPAILEMKYVHIYRLLTADFRSYFLFEKPADAFRIILSRPIRELRFDLVGSTTLIAFGLLLLLILNAVPVWAAKLGRAIWMLGAASLLMTTRLSQPVWRVIPRIEFMQFPFRWLAITTAGVAVAAGVGLSTLKSSKHRLIFGVAFSFVLIANLGITVLAVERASYDAEAIKGALFEPEAHEYQPVWLPKDKNWKEKGHDVLQKQSVVVDAGDAQAFAVDDIGASQHYVVNATTEALIRVRRLYFPGWVARVDGNVVAITPSEDGNIQLTVPPGEHVVTLQFSNTPPRTAGALISFCSLVILVSFALSRLRRRSIMTKSFDEPIAT